MALLIQHLAAWTIAVAQEAEDKGDEERRVVTLNLAPILLSHTIATAWETLCQRTEEAAANPIGEPMGHA